MTHERDSPDDLYPFAQVLVRKLVKRHGLEWNSHRIEDAVQDLFLADLKMKRDALDARMKAAREPATPTLSFR